MKEQKKSYLIEFVSANPTGPLHVGHCRGAIMGDVIANVFSTNRFMFLFVITISKDTVWYYR